MHVESATPVTISPTLPSGAITGTISGSASEPVEGATVEATSTIDDATVATATTDASGNYTLGLPPGRYHVRVSSAGASIRYVDGTTTGAIETADATTFSVTPDSASTGDDLQLVAQSTITGTAEIDFVHTGNVIVVAYDAASGLPVSATTSLSTGAFTIPGLSDTAYHVRFIVPNQPTLGLVWGTTGTDIAQAASITPSLSGTSNLGFVHLGEDCQPGYAGADLSGASFAGGNFFNTKNGQSCSFSGSNLTGTNLSGADLYRANLASANLTNTDLTGATLQNVSSGGVTGAPAALPADWHLVNGYLIGPNANLQGAALSGASLSGFNLSGANLDNANLTSTNLTNADLSGIVNMLNTTVTNADFTGANLTSVFSRGLVGTPAALPTHWKLYNGYLVGNGASLTQANLYGIDLSDVDMGTADLEMVNLGAATLTNTDLGDVDLAGVHGGGISGTPAALPAGWVLTNGYLIGPGADLTGANLAGVDLQGLDLTDAVLNGASSGGITGTPTALPTGWVLTNGYLIGPGAKLTGANLAGVDLQGLDLTDAVLNGASSGGITGTPTALPSQWQLIGGYLIGPYADLQGANLAGLDLSGTIALASDLSGADLSGADLSGANFIETDLTGANLHATNLGSTVMSGAILTGVISGGIVGTPVELPTGWSLVDGTLVFSG